MDYPRGSSVPSADWYSYSSSSGHWVLFLGDEIVANYRCSWISFLCNLHFLLFKISENFVEMRYKFSTNVKTDKSLYRSTNTLGNTIKQNHRHQDFDQIQEECICYMSVTFYFHCISSSFIKIIMKRRLSFPLIKRCLVTLRQWNHSKDSEHLPLIGALEKKFCLEMCFLLHSQVFPLHNAF